MILKLETDATAEPVKLIEMKEHLGLSTATHPHDDMINGFIKSARILAESKTHMAFMPQTWKLYIDDFPGDTDAITLPIYPLSTVATAVTVTFIEDASGASTTLPATHYTVDSDSEPPRIYPSYSASYDNDWPDNVKDMEKAVCVQFICGHKLNASSECNTNIEPARTWIKLRVTQMYEHRTPIADGRTVTDLNRSYIDGLLDPYALPEAH